MRLTLVASTLGRSNDAVAARPISLAADSCSARRRVSSVSSSFSNWDQELANAPLKLCHSRVINAEVLRGMDLNSKHSEDLIIRRLPKFMHQLGRDFAGVRGSRIYNALRRGELSYRSYCFQKP